MDNLLDAVDGVVPFSVNARRSSASAHCTGSAETRVPLSVMSAIENCSGNAWTTLAPMSGVAAAESLRKLRRVGRVGIRCESSPVELDPVLIHSHNVIDFLVPNAGPSGSEWESEQGL